MLQNGGPCRKQSNDLIYVIRQLMETVCVAESEKINALHTRTGAWSVSCVPLRSAIVT